MGLRGLRILRDPGPVTGDCKAFAMTVAWLLAGRSLPRMAWHLLTFRSVIWLCLSPAGGLHVALWHRGRGWACSVQPVFSTRTPNRLLMPARALAAPLIIAVLP